MIRKRSVNKTQLETIYAANRKPGVGVGKKPQQKTQVPDKASDGYLL